MSDTTKKALIALAALAVIAGCLVVAIVFDSPTSVMILATVALLGGSLGAYVSTAEPVHEAAKSNPRRG